MEPEKKVKCLLFALIISLIIALMSALLFGCQRGAQKVSKKEADKEKVSERSERQKKSKYFSSEKVTAKEKRGNITFKIGIDAFEGAKKVGLWLPYPVSSEYQDITDVKVEGNFSDNGVYREGEFGNTILYAEWKEPKDRPEMSFSFKVKRNEIIKKDFLEREDTSTPPEIAKFLAVSSLGPTSGKCKATAEKAIKEERTTLAKAEAIYDYLVENFQRDDTIIGCGAGDVNKLLVSKKGKCADIHSVFVAMARSVGVPAREIFGIRMPSKQENDITKSYHCRAEFYLSSYGWVPVDASDVLKLMLKENLRLDDQKVKEACDYFFGSQNETYIDFGTGRDLVLNPPQQGQKLNYFMYPYAEVDGKPLDCLSQQELKYTVTFEEF